MISYVATRKPRITLAQRRTRVVWCYEHLSWSVNHRSKDESNYEILNRKNRIYIYVVFDTIQLNLNVHNNVYIQDGVLGFAHTDKSLEHFLFHDFYHERQLVEDN